MAELLYRAAGRLSVLADPLRPALASSDPALRPRDAGPQRLDRTGLLMSSARPLRILHRDTTVLWAEYDSMAHSLWRSQELSLVQAHRDELAPPLLDFGAGDGSFASVLFDRVEHAVENDADALAVARGFGVYRQLHLVTDGRLPLPDGAVRSILSNSVLEHVLELEGVLRELRRVLAPGGSFVFTVPLPSYTEHLIRYFGAAAARRVNAESVHRNLLAPEAWRGLLQRNGFTVVLERRYQPARFTFWYRMFRLLGRRGLSRFWPSLPGLVWRRAHRRLITMVRESIAGAADGANLFVVAR